MGNKIFLTTAFQMLYAYGNPFIDLMIKNRWNAVALNVEPTHPRRDETSLIKRNLAYTQEVMQMTDRIRQLLESAWGDNKKSLNEVMADFMDLIWRYYAFDNATYRFWSTVDACIENYFENRMYKKSVCSSTLHEEWQRFKYLKESNHKDTISIVNNKYSFRDFFAKNGFPVCKRLGVLKWRGESMVYENTDGELCNVEMLWTGGRTSVFCKPIQDCQGHGCGLLSCENGQYLINGIKAPQKKLSDFFSQEKLVEEVLVNHPLIRAIHPASLNTCRLITMKEDDGSIRLFRAVMRMGGGGSSVDNWCSGGLAAEIKHDGTLSEYALYEDYAKPDEITHPDTGVVFKNVKIPYYQEAVKLVTQAHGLCSELQSVGWDVAITPIGPVLVEGNVFYETFQAVCGGLRDEMRRYLFPPKS